MLKILIKNYLKLIYRDYISWAICILSPIFLIFITSTSLKQSFASNVEIAVMEVGYNGCLPKMTDEKIRFCNVPEDEAMMLIAEGRLAGYIEEKDETITLYLPEFMTNESIYLRNHVMWTLEDINIEEIQSVKEKMIVHTTLEAKRPPSSIDYYGRIEFIGCIWISAIFAGRIAILERKDKAIVRFKQAQISSFIWWGARFIATFISYSVVMGIVAVWLSVRMKMMWGEYIYKVIPFLVLVMVCFTCFNTFLSFVIKKEMTLVMSIWVLWFINGFLGGSFQNYWYNFIPEKIQKLSVLYYINRSIIELSMDGQSRYLQMGIVLMLILMIISLLLSFWYLGRERRADV